MEYNFLTQRTVRLAVLCLMGAMALTAQAVDWSGEVTLEGDITEDVTLTGDTVLTSNLAPGSKAAYTISGKITGNYKLTKKGVGRIILTNAANDFGSLQIDAGFVEATKTGALGTAPITITGSTSSYCQLRFSTGSTAANFSNAIHLQNNSSRTYPAIWFDRPMAMLTLSGAITSDGDLFIVDAYGNSGSSRYITISGDVTVAHGKRLECPISYDTVISGKVTADLVCHLANGTTVYITDGCGVANSRPRGSLGLSNAENQIGKLQVEMYGNIRADVDNAFGGAWLYQTENTETGRGQFRINGKSQTCAYISTGACAAGDLLTTAMSITSGSTASTLTLTGGVASATSYSYFTGNQTIKIDNKSDAGDFMQTFHSRSSPMTGKLIANRGTLQMAGTSKFAEATAVEVGSGGTFDCESTAEGALASVTKVTVANGGTLKLGSGMPMPFTDAKYDMELSTGATLDIPYGTVITAYRLTVDGTQQGVKSWTHADYEMIPEGVTIISTYSDPETTETITWTGGAGSDTSMTKAANWGKVGEDLSFVANKYQATFAEGGAEATVIGQSTLNKLTLKGDGFKLKPASDSAELHVMDGGIEFADDWETNEEPHAYTNAVRTFFVNTTTMFVPNNDTMRFEGGIETLNTLKLYGNGTTWLCGTNYIAGQLYGLTGTVYLSGYIANSKDYGPDMSAASDSNGRGLIFPGYNPKACDAVVFAGLTLDKPYYGQAKSGGDLAFTALAGTTNIIRSQVSLGTPANKMQIDGDLELSGGLVCSWTSGKKGNGKLIISGKPATLRGPTHKVSPFNVEGGELVLNVSSNTFGVGQRLGVNAGRVTCGVNDVFSSDVDYFLMNSSGTFDMGGTTQHVGYVHCGKTTGTITGTAGSRLVFTRGSDTSGTCTNLKCNVSGAVSVAMEGAKTLCLSGKSFASGGDLEAKSGTLELASGASWLNGTNIIVKGTGTLILADPAKAQIGPQAVFHFADSGKVEINENVTNVVYRAETNGVWLAAGNYTCIDGGADRATGIQQLTGKGVLSVLATTYDVSGGSEPDVTNVVITESWVNEYVKPGNVTDTPTGANSNGYPYWKSYVLGLTPTNPVSKPIIKGVQNADPNKLAFRLGNVTYNAASGVKATYKVKASDTISGSSWTDVSAEVDADKDATVALPTDSPVKYYKVYINYSN